MTMQRNVWVKTAVTLLSALLLSSVLLQIHETGAADEAGIVIHPGLVQVNPGDNFTLTVNVTNVASLSTWQLTLKYNVTVMNVTSMWVPETSVFAGLLRVDVEPVFGVDILDGLGYVNFGSTLFSDTISATNGLLCMINCTALAEGETTVIIASKTNRAHASTNEYDAFYSFLLDAENNEMPYNAISATVINGGGSSRPIALFTVTPEISDNTTRLVLNNKPIAGDVVYVQAYVGLPVTFNASASFGVMTLTNGTKVRSSAAIGKYIWDFGDGNYTSISYPIITSDPIINHTYTVTGRFDVVLKVEDKETPPAQSDTVGIPILVGLALDYFNWAPFVYAVLAAVAAGFAYYIYKEIKRYVRLRREAKAQRLLMRRSQPS